MNSKIFIKTILACAALSLMLSQVLLAQDAEKSRLSRALERSMSREAPLSEDDYKIYMANLRDIFALSQAPQGAAELAKNINSWSENRFAYVSTKMAVGLSLLLKPEDPRNQQIPAFARPSEQEMRIIRNHRDELVKAMETLAASPGQ